MATAEQIMGSYGITEAELSPAQQFRRFATQFAPMQRNLMYTQEAPLQARYMLREPTYGGSFQDWLGAYPGGLPSGGVAAGTTAGPAFDPYTAAQLRARAQGAGALAGMTPAQYQQYQDVPGEYAGAYAPQLQNLTPAEAALYRSDYYSGQGAGENVANLVNLLALQNQGYGPTTTGQPQQYGGRMQQGIGNVIGELFDQYILKNPEAPAGSFLNWYLQRSGPGGRLAFGQPAATT
jgi:hypothetical protein